MQRKINNTHFFMVLLILLLFFSCNNESKENYVYTKTIKKNLYIEIYEPSRGGGVFASSKFSYFLTDSNKLNVFIDNIDDDYNYEFISDSNILIAIKYKNVFIGVKKPRKKEFINIIGIDLKTGEKF